MKKRSWFLLGIVILVSGAGFLTTLWFIGGRAAATNKMVGDETGSNQQTTAPNLFEAAAAELQKPVLQYQNNDLTVNETETAEALKKYALKLREIIANHFAADQENAARLLLGFLDSNDTDKLAKLNALSALHRTTVLRLKEMAVPKTLSTPHLNLINNLSALGESIYIMSQVATEPVAALTATEFYPQRYAAFIKSLLDFNLYFAVQEITFPDGQRFDIPVKLYE